MSVNSFQNRDGELAELAELVRKPGAQFLAIYGRRRIGKTALLLRWLQRTKIPSCYFVAQRTTSRLLLDQFSRAVSPLLGTHTSLSFASWEDALLEIGHRARAQRVILVIDELPYLLESVPSFASVLQAVWDRHLRDTRLVLAVAGSRYHMMEETFASGKGPLFGRTTADLLLGEIPPPQLRLFLPRYSPRQLVEVFSVIGGVPKYLEMWDDRRPVLWNIEKTILSPVSIFRHEPILLIQDEIAEPRTYLGVLEALGAGARGPTQISRQAGIALPHVGKYLRTLRDLGLVRRIVSLEAIGRRDTRQTRYEIADPYLRFHFTFIRPHLHLLEQRRVGRLMQLIRERFEGHVGRCGYEEICRRHVATLADAGELPFEVMEVGRIWDKRVEIDVAALDRRSRSVLLAECRWRNTKMNDADLDGLHDKAAALSKTPGYQQQLALFSRSGFTKRLRDRAEKEHVLLVEGPLV